MQSEVFNTVVRGIKLQVSLDDGRISFRAHYKNETIAYDSGFEVGFGKSASTMNRYYFTTGGAHFMVTAPVRDQVLRFLRKHSVRINDYSSPNILGKKPTSVIVDEIYPVTAVTGPAFEAAAVAAQQVGTVAEDGEDR
jgi:hypothetical protein